MGGGQFFKSTFLKNVLHSYTLEKKVSFLSGCENKETFNNNPTIKVFLFKVFKTNSFVLYISNFIRLKTFLSCLNKYIRISANYLTETLIDSSFTLFHYIDETLNWLWKGNLKFKCWKKLKQALYLKKKFKSEQKKTRGNESIFVLIWKREEEFDQAC